MADRAQGLIDGAAVETRRKIEFPS